MHLFWKRAGMLRNYRLSRIFQKPGGGQGRWGEGLREKWAVRAMQSKRRGPSGEPVRNQLYSRCAPSDSQHPRATSASPGGLCKLIRPFDLRKRYKCPCHSPLSDIGIQNTAFSSKVLHSGPFRY